MSTFNENEHPRKPKGVRGGGQFTSVLANEASTLTLEEEAPETFSFLSARESLDELEELAGQADELPSRFYSTQLFALDPFEYENVDDPAAHERELSGTHLHSYLHNTAFGGTQTLARWGQFAVTKAEAEAVTDQQLDNLMASYGFEYSYGDPHCRLYTNDEGVTYLLESRPQTKVTIGSVRLRYGGRKWDTCVFLSRRHAIGLARLSDVSGVDALTLPANSTYNLRELEEHGDQADFIPVAERLRALDTFRGRTDGARQMKKYLKNRQSTIAGVFDDKKHQDATHQEMSRNSSLHAHFGHIELDNDVSPEKWQAFEQECHEALAKLPPIPREASPDLRVRYLGKHRATGMYSPFHNAVAIDVRDAGSTIHELGHYYDHVVGKNASLSREFVPLARRYSAELPRTLSECEREYLQTPTEVFARGFDMYAREKLGVRGALSDADFSSPDHAPIHGELKADMFAFFDRLFNK